MSYSEGDFDEPGANIHLYSPGEVRVSSGLHVPFLAQALGLFEDMTLLEDRRNELSPERVILFAPSYDTVHRAFRYLYKHHLPDQDISVYERWARDRSLALPDWDAYRDGAPRNLEGISNDPLQLPIQLRASWSSVPHKGLWVARVVIQLSESRHDV